MALDELGAAAGGPDRLADAARRTAVGPAGHELAPGRDDVRGVGAELVHVGERDAVGIGPQLRAQQVDLRRGDGDEHRLAGLEPLAQERGSAGDELVVAPVHPGNVMEAGRG